MTASSDASSSHWDRQLWDGSLWTTGPGRLGTFQGHLIPAVFYLGFSMAIFIMVLRRSRAGHRVHGPEQNPIVSRRFAYSLIVASSLGLFYETVLCVGLHPELFETTVPHQTMYASYLLVGVLLLLESKGRLGPDSGKRGLALAQFVTGVLWYDHAGMKVLMEDQKFHYTLGWVSWAGAVANAYSVLNPESIEAYMAGPALTFLNGTWLITTGLYTCCLDVSHHLIASYLCLQFVAIVAVISLVGALFGQSRSIVDELGAPKHQHSFRTLQSNEDDDGDSLHLTVF